MLIKYYKKYIKRYYFIFSHFSARGKKKKGYGKMILVIAGVAKATMLYAMIHAVAALAGKALIVAKVALTIATAVALKKALGKNNRHP